MRANEGTNPFYLHFALPLSGAREQFHKWSTGSSYPAILDDDVKKTRIPVPAPAVQDEITAEIFRASKLRNASISKANTVWNEHLSGLTRQLAIQDLFNKDLTAENDCDEDGGSSVIEQSVWDGVPSIESIDNARRKLEILK